MIATQPNTIELTDVYDNGLTVDISLRVPSESAPDGHYSVAIWQDGQFIRCNCPDFCNRHAKHEPREADTQFHCKHVRWGLEFLNASNTIASELTPSDCCADCGQILEQTPVPDGCGDYYSAWVCPRCEVTK